MKKQRTIKSLAAVAAIIGCQSHGVWAQTNTLTDEQIQQLLQRVNQLEQEVKALQRNQTTLIATNAADTAGLVYSTNSAKAAPTISLGANGLIARSSDSNFTMIAHGYAQADYRSYFGEKTTPDAFLLRRVRPIVEGTVWQDYNYRLMLDVGSGDGSGSTANNTAVLDDAYVNAHFWQQAQFQIGKYKSPLGLERLQSTADLYFVETGFATEMTPNYDVGAMVHNDYFNQPIGYALGVFTGAGDNQSQDRSAGEGKDIVGRLFLQPFINSSNAFKSLGFGVAGSVGPHTAGTVPTYVTPGQQTFFGYNSTNLLAAGSQYRLDPQLYYYYGPFGIMSEYILSSQKYDVIKNLARGEASRQRFNNAAWQVEATCFLTGEENSFKSTSLKHVEPLHNFGLGSGSGWGAFEFVARLQALALDNHAFNYTANATDNLVLPGSAEKATSWGAGLNWYLNPNVKLNLDYESTTFTSGTSLTGTAAYKPEHVILSRAQFAF